MPPDLLSTSHEIGSTIEIGPNGATIIVMASDEDDGDVVSYVWWDDDGYIGEAVPFDVGSALDLEPEPALQGNELRCLVSDGHAGHTLTLNWYLEVL